MRRAFTLIELLTAMAVLALVLVMMLQVVSGLLQSTRTQNQQMDSVSGARRALDVLAWDLSHAVIGENITILAPEGAGATNLLAMLTARRGSNGAVNHRFLAVAYATNAAGDLLRSYRSSGYGESDLLAAATNTTTPDQPLASGILAIQIRALADGTNSYTLTAPAIANWATTNDFNGNPLPANYKALLTRSPTFSEGLTNRTRAIEVWIAACDEQNYKLLEGASKLAAARSALGANPSLWRASIDNASIPAQTKSSIRILNKTIPLP